MTRLFMLMLALVLSVAGSAMAQQVTVGQPQAARVPQPTRSYRSYSIAPSAPQAATMGDVRPTGRHAGEASWRHATAKAAGHYNGGR